jgi:Leucine-rich repeat (LRR) protein
VDATALCALTGLNSLRLDGVEGATGEWVLELGGFTMLTSLHLHHCTVTDAEVLAVGKLTALKTLILLNCVNVTDVAVGTLSGLTGLTGLNLRNCRNVTDLGVGRLSGLTALSTLYLSDCPNVTAAGKHALRTASPNLTIID